MIRNKRGVSLLLAFSIIFTLFILGSAVFWKIEASKSSLENERMRSLNLESDRNREQLEVLLTPLNNGSILINITNRWNKLSHVKALMLLSEGNITKVIHPEMTVHPGKCAYLAVEANPKFDEVLVLTDLGNVFTDSPAIDSRDMAEEGIFESDINVIEPNGVVAELSTVRDSFIDIIDYETVSYSLQKVYYVYARGNGYLRGGRVYRTWATVDAQTDYHDSDGWLDVPQHSHLEMTENFTTAKGIFVNIHGIADAKAYGLDAVYHPHTEAYCKVSITLSFPDSRNRMIFYRVPIITGSYVSDGGYGVKDPGGCAINNTGPGRYLTQGWKVFTTYGDVAYITFEIRYYATEFNEYVDSRAKIDFSNLDNKLNLIIVEYSEKGSVKLADLNLKPDTYIFKHLNGTVYRPFKMVLGSNEYVFNEELIKAFTEYFTGSIAQKYDDFDKKFDNIGRYELIHISTVLGYTENGEMVYKLSGILSWVLTPDLPASGGDPYEVINTDGEHVWGTVYSKTVKNGSTYVFFTVKNNLPRPLKVSTMISYLSASGVNSYLEVTTIVNPGEIKEVSYTSSQIATINPTIGEVFFTPVLTDWNEPNQFFYWLFFKATWGLRLSG